MPSCSENLIQLCDAAEAKLRRADERFTAKMNRLFAAQAERPLHHAEFNILKVRCWMKKKKRQLNAINVFYHRFWVFCYDGSCTQGAEGGCSFCATGRARIPVRRDRYPRLRRYAQLSVDPPDEDLSDHF